MDELKLAIIKKVIRCQDLEKLQTVDKILSSAASGRTFKRRITYKGFGEEHTGPEWGRCLGVPRKSMYRYLQRGLSIEQIVAYRGIDYPPKK